MKLAQIVTPAFNTTVYKLSKANLPLLTAFKLKKILKKIAEEQIRYEETRQEAAQKFGKKKEDGTLEMNEKQIIQFEPDQFEAFSKEIISVLNVPIEVESISLADLGSKVELTAEDLLILDEIIKD